MNFLSEKQARNYFLFILLCNILLICFGFLCIWHQTEEAETMLIRKENAIASELLRLEVAPEDIATAFKNEEITASGSLLLGRLAHTESTPGILFPSLSRFSASFSLFLLSGLFLFSAVFLAGSIFFMYRRENLYRQAVSVIFRFAEGDFSRRLPRAREGTLYHLFGSINQLAAALQVKIESEHQAKEFLKDTVSDISHQLKTPLAALSMYTEIISGEPDHPQTVREFSQKSMQSLARMEHLIHTLLKIMRLDAGSITFEEKTYYVKKLISHAIGELLIRAEAERKEIILDGCEADTVVCDFEWTSQAIGNLVKNALDYTPSGGSVKISWQRSPLMLRLLVSDNGCGISSEDMPHIFERFYRSRSSGDTNGVGLGLPLAKTIIEGQGGILSVQSSPGMGTVFSVSFLTKL